jgi:hypothetical protein
MSDSSKSPRNCDEIQALISNPLELPDGSGFTSTAVKVGIREMIALSEAYLPIVNSQPDFEAKKKKEAFDEPFVL